MSNFAYPRLVDLDARSIDRNGEALIVLTSRSRLSDQGVSIPAEMAVVLDLLDGRRTIRQIHEEALVRAGIRFELEVLEELIHALDGIYVLDSARRQSRKRDIEQAFLASDVRAPVCAGGVYSRDPKRLRRDLDSLYTMPGGAGLPTSTCDPQQSRLKMVLSPHIDFRRGGGSFSWAYRAIVEQTAATTFIILATSHYSLRRFVLTHKDFQTPLGIAKTNAGFVRDLESRLGKIAFEDEIAHKPEHSIELQVVLLQHALDGARDISIVPILVGSFGDYLDEKRIPAECETTRGMIQAIAEASANCGEEVCTIVSGDLAHIGPKFGDTERVDKRMSQWCREADTRLLTAVETGSPDRLLEDMSADGDARRICGFPPLYVGLAATQARRGRLLCYDQYLDPNGSEIVSFASMAFE